jgi:hypothetical protein
MCPNKAHLKLATQVVVKPLPKSAFGDGDSSYIVLNRPYAFMEWSV